MLITRRTFEVHRSLVQESRPRVATYVASIYVDRIGTC